MPNDQTVYRPTGRVVTRRIGEDNLLVPVSGGAAGENAVFPVNDTGLFIWEQLIAGKTIHATVEEMVDVFAVERSQALTDCEEMMQALLKQSLLEEVVNKSKKK